MLVIYRSVETVELVVAVGIAAVQLRGCDICRCPHHGSDVAVVAPNGIRGSFVGYFIVIQTHTKGISLNARTQAVDACEPASDVVGIATGM
ncbi:MAG: hypothetical protein Q7V19_12485 [Bacteroidales bacterium]|nr:hypothetical protein [Bacteroidales bacterium]